MMSAEPRRDGLEVIRATVPVFDLVIGDFGREASTRYLSVLAREERRLLSRALGVYGLPFLDEYRRIMFSHVGALSFLKQQTISRVWSDAGHLTDDVLLAVKGHEVPADLVARLACIVHDAGVAAHRLGFGRMRVALPCNSLSGVIASAAHLAADSGRFATAAESIGIEAGDASPLPEITTHGVVQSSLRELSRTTDVAGTSFTILGSAMTQQLYEHAGAAFQLEIDPLDVDQQAVVDDAVLACIEGSEESLALARSRMQTEIVGPSRRRHPKGAIVEACTDFDFGLGLDSLELMARDLVRDCYGDLTSWLQGRDESE